MNYNFVLITLLIMLVFILIMIGITSFLYRRIAKRNREGIQISALGRQEEENTYNYNERLFGDDEIGDLVKSFNSMENALRQQIKNVARMSAEQERVRAELSVATRIQADMVPTNFSDISDAGLCDIYGSMHPAKEVGGDFYDFFPLDEDKLCIVIADVSGKGVPAALFMTKSMILIKQRALAGGNPAQILEDVNNQLCADNGQMLFVTVWLGIVNTKTGEVDYCNAGHEFQVLLHEGKSSLLKEASNDPPLALAENFPFTDRIMQLQDGDGLFIYTDGLPEAKDGQNNRYGIERMLRILDSCAPDESCEEIMHTLGCDLASFMSNEDPFDDVTMLVIRLHMA